MKKLLKLFAVACLLGITTHAMATSTSVSTQSGGFSASGNSGNTGSNTGNNVITYTAPNKLNETTYNSDSGLHTNAFNVSITSHTFSNGTGTITFSGDVTSIGHDAFRACTGLTSITIPNSVTSIGEGAFRACTGLTSITIPSSVTSIGYEAFYGCSGLTSVTIPNSVTSIGSNAFWGCSGLTSVHINDLAAWCGISFSNHSDPIYTSRSSNPLSYAHHLYLNDTEITDLVIPNSVTSIGKWAFYGFTGLTSVTIGNSVTSIGEGAFRACTGLTSITLPNSVSSIEYGAFMGCTGLTSVTIGNSVTSIGKDAFSDCTGLTSVHINDLAAWCGISFSNYDSNPLIYAHHLYLNGTEITDLVIPNSVTSIGHDAFRACTGLTSITIPNSVTSIGYRAFYGCTGLTSVTIGNSVTSIGEEAFYGCSGLTSITIPNSVTSIGSYAFYDCTNLKIVYNESDLPIKKGTMGYGYVAYYADKVYNGYIVGDFVIKNDTILNGYLGNNNNVTIPNFVTSIGDEAFYGCSGLKSVIIGSGVTAIGKNAFAGCTKLYNVTCYAAEPPTANQNSFANYNVYLNVPCSSLQDYQLDAVFGSFKYIQCIEAEEAVVTNMTVTPAETEATFAWPTTATANSYTLTITKDGVVFCTLTFNANGQLINIAFAPSRGVQQAEAAELTATGYQFTVTGLSNNAAYAYVLKALDASKNTLATYNGTFTTGTTALEDVNVEEKPVKFIRDGKLFILRNGIIYNAAGQVVK